MKTSQAELTELRGELRELILEDALSFNAVMRAMKLPKATEAEQAARKEKINEATRGAILVPLETARRAFAVLKLLADLLEIGNQSALSDLGVGAQLALTAVRGASYNVTINLSSLTSQEEADDYRKQIGKRVAESEGLAEAIASDMMSRIT